MTRARHSACTVLGLSGAIVLAGCAAADRAPRAAHAAADLPLVPALADRAPRAAHAAADLPLVPALARHLVVTLLNPERIAVVDLRDGRVVAERAVPGGTLCGDPLLLLGGRVVLPIAGRREVVAASLDLSLRGEPRPLGVAARFVPSTVRGRVWLVRIDLGRAARPVTSIQEVDAHGRVTRTAHGRPPVGWLNAASAGGLVFEQRRRLTVWDPDSGERVERLPGGPFVTASDPGRLAWCGDPCRRMTIDTVARRSTIPAPGGTSFLPTGGAFAPHGRPLLAAQVGSFTRPRLALVDIRAGTTTVVPGGTRASPSATPVWSASGDRIYYTGAHGRVYSYRPGGRPHPTPIRFRDRVVQLVAAG